VSSSPTTRSCMPDRAPIRYRWLGGRIRRADPTRRRTGQYHLPRRGGKEPGDRSERPDGVEVEMIRWRTVLVLGAMTTLLPFTALAASSSSGSSTPASSSPGSSTVRLKADVIAGIGKLKAVRHTAASQIVDVAVSMTRPDRTGEAALARAQADPTSPQYRKF